MTLQIHPVAEIEPRELRALVIENLHALLGDGARAIDNMPEIDECCLTAADPDGGLMLLSYDAKDPQRALLSGLSRMDLLDSDVATLFVHDYRPPTRLLVLAPEPPPGMSLFDGHCAIGWQRLQVLSVNGELGMLLDTQTGGLASRHDNVEPIALETRNSDPEAELNEEEEEHFQQL